MSPYRTAKRGFTLVEILIVVIILGILAAIVIPQFTNASTEARENSLRSLLQTIRSQVELYKLQHGDLYPTDDGAVDGAWDWAKLTGRTNQAGDTGADATLFPFGPYLQSTPVNPLVTDVAARSVMGTAAAADVGFFITADGKIEATNASGAEFQD
jgi:general secretion pathway protein G